MTIPLKSQAIPQEVLAILNTLQQPHSWTVQDTGASLQITLNWKKLSAKCDQVNNIAVDQDASVPRSVPVMKKHKSPSTRRRDEARRQAYLALNKGSRHSSTSRGAVPQPACAIGQTTRNVDAPSRTTSMTPVVLTSTGTQLDKNTGMCEATCQTDLREDTVNVLCQTEPVPSVESGSVVKQEDQSHTGVDQVPVECTDPTHKKCKILKVIRQKSWKENTYKYLVKWKYHTPKANSWVSQERLDEELDNLLEEHNIPCAARKQQEEFKEQEVLQKDMFYRSAGAYYRTTPSMESNAGGNGDRLAVNSFNGRFNWF